MGDLVQFDSSVMPLSESDITDMLGPQGLSMGDLERITIPTGGSTYWDLDEGPEEAIRGVILDAPTRRVYWSEDLDDASDGEQPDCKSQDGVTGVGDPGGDCLSCPLSQFGPDGERPPCRQFRELLVVQSGEILPVIVKVPATSLKPFRKYTVALFRKGTKLWNVVTKMSLAKHSSGKNNYSTIEFGIERRLEENEVDAANAMRDTMLSVLQWSGE